MSFSRTNEFAEEAVDLIKNDSVTKTLPIGILIELIIDILIFIIKRSSIFRGGPEKANEYLRNLGFFGRNMLWFGIVFGVDNPNMKTYGRDAYDAILTKIHQTPTKELVRIYKEIKPN